MLTALVCIVGAVALLLYLLNKWSSSVEESFEKQGIPHVKSSWKDYVSITDFRKSAPEVIRKIYNQLPDEKIFGTFNYGTTTFIVRDPELIRKLGIKDFNFFEDHPSLLNENTDSTFTNSLIMLKGEKWRQMRATLSPLFTGSKMRQMFELVSECADGFPKYLLKQAEIGHRNNYEMKEFFSKYTNDVIATCAFGIKVNSLENSNNEFYLTVQKLLKSSTFIRLVKFMLLKVTPRISKALGIKIISKQTEDFFKSMVLDTMKIREEKGIYRPDMINLLMQVRKGDLSNQTNEELKQENSHDGFAAVEESQIGKSTVKRQWNDIEIVAQCMLFFFAGFDTSSNVLSFLAYELAVNPDVQKKLYDEIRETSIQLNGQRIDYETLQKMKYLDQVVSEALRKWPAAILTDRICINEYMFDDGNKLKFVIKKGSNLWFPITALHYDPNYFPEPEKFDPERFSDENKHSIVPGTYIPFGLGPRSCIGSRFALMQMKSIIYYLLIDFTIEPNEKTQIPLKLKKSPVILSSEKGIHLEFKRRNEAD